METDLPPSAVNSIAGTLFRLLGNTLIATFHDPSRTTPASSPSSPMVQPQTTVDKVPHVLLVHSIPGIPSVDFQKIFARASLPKVKARDVARTMLH